MIVGELPEVNWDVFLRIGGNVMHSPLLYLVVSLMALDFITGMGKAFLTGKYSSKIGLEGVVKHIMILLLVIFLKFFGHIFDFQAIAHGATILFSFNYVVSVIENMESAGIEFPEVIKNKFLQMKKDAEDEIRVSKDDEVVIRKRNAKKGIDR